MLFFLGALAAGALTPPSQPPADADPVVCKRSKTADVGTHMRPEKVCMKKSDWELSEKNTKQELQTLQDRAALNPGRQPEGPRPH